MKTICDDLFFCSYKNEFFFLIERSYWKKQKENIIIVEEKKAAEYYLKNKDVIKEKANNKYKNLSKEKKEAKKE